MNFLDITLLIFTAYFIVFCIVFLLYQFEVIDLPEKTMVRWCRANDILETILLILTRFWSFGFFGKIGLGIFYLLSIILLVLQFIYAEFGPGRKLLDCLWMLFYVFLFLLDVCNMNLTQILGQLQASSDFQAVDRFLKDSFVGQLVIGIIVPIIRNLIVEAVNKNSD